MEKICISNCKIVFFLYLLFHFSLGSSDYTPPNKYFINCGSDHNVSANENSRVFIGDENPDRSSFSFSHSSHLQQTGSSTDTPVLYKTARVFKVHSCYELQIEQNGNYMVRLHFYPFSSMDNLSLARFNVSTSTVLLLSQSNFSLLNTSNSPLIEEFILTINVGKFRFYFTPFDESSFAFVNAIEAFLVPPALFPNNTGLVSRGLRVIHRIKVGGDPVKPDDDKLWRNWLPDDPYLLTKNATQERSYAEDGLKYQAGNGTATEYTAPDWVYKSARVNETTSPFINITWSFEVSKNAKHFVRVHFCDVTSLGENTIMEFSLYIYDSNKTVNLQPVGVPFYEDLWVDSDNSGFMNISISPRDTYMPAAFLNGLEIMQFMTNLSSPITNCSLASGESGKKHLFIIIGSVVGGVAFIIILMVVLFFTLKCRKTKLLHETSEWPLTPLYAGSSHTRISELTGNVSLDSLHLGLKAPFHEILRATNNFDSKLMIGEGGFGKVYKGTLWNGMKVAIKRSEPGCGQGRPEFQTEIMILSRIRHRHLVSIYGYCDENSEMILVYEFMEKGTLRDHLYNSNKDSKDTSSLAELSWSQRLEICIGAAKGLNYLHTGSDDAIIHRDVKSTNILLDQNFVAKVADFGLSRSGPLDQYISTEVKGTFGYLDPEYFSGLQLTQKSDVYSFGVVLLEVLCARPAINNTLPREQVNLAEWGVFCQKERQLDKIIDPSLVGQINPNSLRKFGEIMEKCLKEHGIDRPNMIDVMWDLKYALQLQHSVARRDPDEDSTNVSWQLSLPVSSPLPFDSASINTEEIYLKAHDGLDMSNISAGEEFSQLITNDAR